MKIELFELQSVKRGGGTEAVEQSGAQDALEGKQDQNVQKLYGCET